MAEKRSALLNAGIPEDLAAGLLKEGVDATKAWLCAETDLNLSGTYEKVFLLMEKDRLITAARPRGEAAHAVRVKIEKKDIGEIRTRQGIGGGFVEALVGGVYVE